jgi:hypothetical protein
MMEELGEYIASKDFRVRTGNAQGSDQAFARGANRVDPGRTWLYLPWGGYEAPAIVEGNHVVDVSLIENVSYRKEHFTKLASDNHPAWPNLTQGVRKLMVRNACIVWGSNLVLAHLNHAKKGGGGTGHGWRIAESLGIERIDLSEQTNIEAIKRKIDELVGMGSS